MGSTGDESGERIRSRGQEKRFIKFGVIFFPGNTHKVVFFLWGIKISKFTIVFSRSAFPLRKKGVLTVGAALIMKHFKKIQRVGIFLLRLFEQARKE
jgi:hypothetical protein